MKSGVYDSTVHVPGGRKLVVPVAVLQLHDSPQFSCLSFNFCTDSFDCITMVTYGSTSYQEFYCHFKLKGEEVEQILICLKIEPYTTYADNPNNRKLDRVSKPIGSHVLRNNGTVTITPGAIWTYKDNYLNRMLGRVGKPYGSHVLRSDGSVTVWPII